MINSKDYENKQLKLNASLRGNPEGSVVNVRVNKDGVPLDRYWRDRMKDSKTDGCVEMIKETKTPKAKTMVAETAKKGE